jgi:hypothetical protein
MDSLSTAAGPSAPVLPLVDVKAQLPRHERLLFDIGVYATGVLEFDVSSIL